LLTDWYISGANAISKEGHIVNIDFDLNLNPFKKQ